MIIKRRLYEDLPAWKKKVCKCKPKCAIVVDFCIDIEGDVLLTICANMAIDIGKQLTQTKELKRKSDTVKTWFKAEEEKLLAMYYSGKTLKDIAKELNRTYKSVKGKLCHLREIGVIYSNKESVK